MGRQGDGPLVSPDPAYDRKLSESMAKNGETVLIVRLNDYFTIGE